ncbi:hypothetical protein ONA91_27450 [Micromonospora sp. DR5-3]|uniref:hypothetical protein n=1 Tax=unclassified Micromonospora TaxID=2617518 RepID=UPI0011D984FC|nr:MULTISPECIES: hypothetical protein [unclassified Micromonospora]MCW3818192.1 hypothetical protein [Micromonospora sp. DR5-3]TYC21643.1 hypothetical protein FXF52_24600 [Micromonospora sp. MP36]
MTGSPDLQPDDVRPRDRSHWAWPWLVLLLALPGAAWSMFVAGIAAAALFGEPPTPGDLATSTAAVLSGASLWLAAAVLSAALFRRVAVPLLCGLAAVAYAVLAGANRPSAPLHEAGLAGWLAAWVPVTSWAIASWALYALLVAAGRRWRRGAPRNPDRR